jgi:hypothetical protein
VIVTGAGTTAGAALVIVDAFILAQGFEREPPSKCGKAGGAADAFSRAATESTCGAAGAFGRATQMKVVA